jgi:GMP synthase (glutamine-hydrolysing)
MGVKTQIVLPENAKASLAEFKPTGIILSGGPASVYEDGAPLVDESFLMSGVPVFGICYGHQLLAQQLNGGKVKPGNIKEFGPALLQISNHDGLFKGVPPEFTVWMNHGDEVAMPPLDAKATAVSGTISVAAMEDQTHHIYGVQFHPEVVHTQFGDQILQNFLTICGESIQKQELNTQYVETMIQDIRDSVLDKTAICALSGGVDSSVAALLVHKAIGTNLTSVYIDSGLMRHDETKLLTEVFKKHYDMPVTIIDAKHDFVRALAGVTDPETKRKIIGKTFR